jgi:acetylornithine deacetylase/succinyl-diaminopimelate desuccinylase-like protein
MSAVDILRKLVEFPTYEQDGTHKCAESLSNELSSAGFHVAVDEFDNVYGSREFAPGNGTFLIETNFDTADSTANWTRNPLCLSVEGDRLYGLDTSTKGGIAAVLHVLKDLEQCKFRKLEVLFLTGYGQAHGKRLAGTEYFLAHNKLEAKIGINLNANVLGDRFMVAVGCGGRVGFTVTTIGKQAHTMEPTWRTMAYNAIYDMMKVIEALRMIPPARMTVDDCEAWSELNVSMIEGGIAINIVPGECKITCERRVLPNGDWDEVKKEVENALGTLRDIEFKVSYFSPERPYLIDRANPAVSLAVDSVRHTLGYTPKLIVQAGITDCAILDQRGGVKTVIMGPGDPLLEHKPDEYVSARKIEEFTRILRYMLTETGD